MFNAESRLSVHKKYVVDIHYIFERVNDGCRTRFEPGGWNSIFLFSLNYGHEKIKNIYLLGCLESGFMRLLRLTWSLLYHNDCTFSNS